MALDKALALAWREWRRLRVPSESYRAGNRTALTYNLEADLDHIASSVYTLGSALMERREWDFVMRSREELIEVDKARAELETGLASLAQADVERYRQYLAATERLLKTIMSQSQVPPELR